MHWKVKKSEIVFTTGFANLKKDECLLPDGRIMPAYYTLQMNDWVNIIAKTKEGKLILIEQYRHSVGEINLEIPGGSIDTHHGESPVDAARRELLEETGYGNGKIIFENWHWPNPALQNNKMWTFVIENCEKIAEPNLDPYEDIQVRLIDSAEITELVRAGKIKHSIILASLYLAGV